MASDGFAARMARYPDEELIRISQADEDDFDLAAVQAAKAELARRGTSEEVIAAVVADVAREERIEEGRSTLPLSNGLWVTFILIGPILFISAGAAFVLLMRGYTQKAKDAFHAIFLGFVFWGLVSVAMSFLI